MILNGNYSGFNCQACLRFLVTLDDATLNRDSFCRALLSLYVSSLKTTTTKKRPRHRYKDGMKFGSICWHSTLLPLELQKRGLRVHLKATGNTQGDCCSASPALKMMPQKVICALYRYKENTENVLTTMRAGLNKSLLITLTSDPQLFKMWQICCYLLHGYSRVNWIVIATFVTQKNKRISYCEVATDE